MKNYSKIVEIILFVGVILLLTLNSGFRNLVIRTIEYLRQKKELEAIKLRNENLRREIYLLENDEWYIDYTIRKELGYLKPGEVEYRFKK
ncbi:MAG: FtsB family cell division protein [Endomicrobiia bacterium]